VVGGSPVFLNAETIPSHSELHWRGDKSSKCMHWCWQNGGGGQTTVSRMEDHKEVHMFGCFVMCKQAGAMSLGSMLWKPELLRLGVGSGELIWTWCFSTGHPLCVLCKCTRGLDATTTTSFQCLHVSASETTTCILKFPACKGLPPLKKHRRSRDV